MRHRPNAPASAQSLAHAAPIQASALALLHARTPIVLAANVVNATLLIAVFINRIDTKLLFTWYAVVLVLSVLRLINWIRHKRIHPLDWRRWQRSAFAASALSGAVWGTAGVIFYSPQSVILATVTAFVLGGMAAGALATLNAHLPSFLAFVLLSLVPFCLRLLAEGDLTHAMMAGMFLMYLIAILVVGPQTHRALLESFALRDKNRELLRSLEGHVRRRTRRQGNLVTFSQKALSGLEFEDLFREASAVVSEGLDHQATLIMEILDGAPTVRILAATGPHMPLYGTHLPVPGRTPLAEAVLSEDVVEVADWSSEETRTLPPYLRIGGSVSSLTVPIPGERGPFGAIEIWREAPPPFASDDVDFVRAVATTIAAALQRHRAEARVQRLALHDPLTGLPNRNLFRVNMNQALSRAERSKTLVALLLIDLDHFKDINDTLGHPTGDRLLEEVAERLRSCVRREFPPARLGGDEFSVILADLESVEGAAAAAEKIGRVCGAPYSIDGNEFRIGASIGITVFPSDGGDVDRLLRNADLALYRAKEEGRNTFQFYARGMSRMVERRMSLLRDLRQALDRNELNLVYQPQVALPSGRITGVEALTRWSTCSRGMVMPAEFIPLAEASGLIVPLSEWSLRSACTQAQQWRAAGLRPITTAVNFSLAQWQRGKVLATFDHLLAEDPDALSLLELEITERAFPFRDEDEFLRRLGQLRQCGLSISIDDFGTGYSNLGRLRQLPVDRIKVDRSFVAGIGTNANTETLVRAIIALARNLGLGVVAEGVEQQVQLDFLCAEGCDFAQGFLLGRPMSPDTFASMFYNN